MTRLALRGDAADPQAGRPRRPRRTPPSTWR